MGIAELELRRHHTNDGVDLTVELDRFAWQIQICAEPATPQAIADQRYLVVPWLLLFGQESAAKRRFDAEQRTKIGRHACAPDTLRHVAAREIETRAVGDGGIFVRGDVFKNVLTLAPIKEDPGRCWEMP